MALTFRTDDALDEALSVLSAAEGISKQDVIRRAVLERFERSQHQSSVEDSAARAMDRWGDVLHRLGTV
jgi:predicted transcriptional regulator